MLSVCEKVSVCIINIFSIDRNSTRCFVQVCLLCQSNRFCKREQTILPAKCYRKWWIYNLLIPEVEQFSRLTDFRRKSVLMILIRYRFKRSHVHNIFYKDRLLEVYLIKGSRVFSCERHEQLKHTFMLYIHIHKLFNTIFV